MFIMYYVYNLVFKSRSSQSAICRLKNVNLIMSKFFMFSKNSATVFSTFSYPFICWFYLMLIPKVSNKYLLKLTPFQWSYLVKKDQIGWIFYTKCHKKNLYAREPCLFNIRFKYSTRALFTFFSDFVLKHFRTMKHMYDILSTFHT